MAEPPTKEQHKRTEKLCPVLSGLTGKWTPCKQEKCALYIKAHKNTHNPNWKLTYQGCGLISTLPYKPKKQETS